MKRLRTIPRGRLALSVLACSLILTGCANSSDLDPARPTDDRLVCAGEPPVPPKPVTDDAATSYVQNLRAAWFSCHNAVTWLRTFYSTQ